MSDMMIPNTSASSQPFPSNPCPPGTRLVPGIGCVLCDECHRPSSPPVRPCPPAEDCSKACVPKQMPMACPSVASAIIKCPPRPRPPKPCPPEPPKPCPPVMEPPIIKPCPCPCPVELAKPGASVACAPIVTHMPRPSKPCPPGTPMPAPSVARVPVLSPTKPCCPPEPCLPMDSPRHGCHDHRGMQGYPDHPSHIEPYDRDLW